MKKRWLIVMAIIMAGATLGWANELFNPGFEDTTLGYWEYTAGVYSVYGDGTEGESCVSLPPLTGKIIQWKNDPNVGEFYTLSADVKVMSTFLPAGQPGKLILRAFDNNWNMLANRELYCDSPNGTWMHFTLEPMLIPQNCTLLAAGIEYVWQHPLDPEAPLRFDNFVLQKGCPYTISGDINHDCVVNLLDFATLAENWLLDCYSNPSNPTCH